jgi:hypothetical protein
MEITISDPIFVPISSHNQLTVWQPPHPPRAIVTHRGHYPSPWMRSNTRKGNIMNKGKERKGKERKGKGKGK